MIKAFGYAAQDATTPLAPFRFERREPARTRRPDRHPLLRRLPLRPPPGPRRVGRRPSSRWCPATRSSAASRRSASSVQEVQGRRPRRRRLHGRLLPHTAQLPRGPGAVLRERLHRAPTTAPSKDRRRRPTAATPTASSSTSASSLQVAGRPRPRRRRAAAVRRHHDLLAAAPLERASQGQKVGVVGLGGLGHMAREARPCHGRRT